jgi:hypothetical protein
LLVNAFTQFIKYHDIRLFSITLTRILVSVLLNAPLILCVKSEVLTGILQFFVCPFLCCAMVELIFERITIRASVELCTVPPIWVVEIAPVQRVELVIRLDSKASTSFSKPDRSDIGQ